MKVIDAGKQHATLHLIGAPSMLSAVSARGGRWEQGGSRLTPVLAYRAAVERGLASNAPILLVGPAGADAHARACGLDIAQRIAPPVGIPRLGRAALRRVAGGIDRVICWNDELVPMAVGIAEHTELVSTRPDLCTVSHRKLSKVTCLTEHDAARWAERQVTAEVIDLTSTPTTPAERRAEARGRLGVPDDALLFAAIADRPDDADARGMVFMLTVLDATGFDVLAMIPRVAANSIAARRHHRATGQAYQLFQTERPATEWLAAADVVVLPRPGGYGADALLESTCRAFGCQIIHLDARGKPTIGPGSAKECISGQSLLDRLDAIVAHTRGAPAHA